MVSTSVAYNWLTLGLGLVFLGFFLICLTYVFNQLITQENIDINNSVLSNQTVNASKYAISWFTYAPYIIIICGFVFTVIGAIENKGSGA